MSRWSSPCRLASHLSVDRAQNNTPWAVKRDRAKTRSCHCTPISISQPFPTCMVGDGKMLLSSSSNSSTFSPSSPTTYLGWVYSPITHSSVSLSSYYPSQRTKTLSLCADREVKLLPFILEEIKAYTQLPPHPIQLKLPPYSGLLCLYRRDQCLKSGNVT